jgi:hypothetical protein
MTKREAQELKRRHRRAAEGKAQQEQEDDWLKHNRKWFKDLVVLANEACRAAGVAFDCTPEQLENLLQAVDPNMLMVVQGGGRMLVKLAGYLARRLEVEDAIGPATPEEDAEAAEPIAPEHYAKVAEASAHAVA